MHHYFCGSTFIFWRFAIAGVVVVLCSVVVPKPIEFTLLVAASMGLILRFDARCIQKTLRAIGWTVALAAFLVLASSSYAGNIIATWTGGNANWDTSSKWDIGVVPNNGLNTYEVLIDGVNPAASTVTLSTNRTVSALTVSAGDTFALANFGNLAIDSPMLVQGRLWGVGTVNGDITIASGGVLAPYAPLYGVNKTLTIGDVSLGNGAEFYWEYPVVHPKVIVNGDLRFGQTATLRIPDIPLTQPVGNYVLFEVAGNISPLPIWNIVLPAGWSSHGVAVIGNQVVLQHLTTAVSADFDGDCDVDGADFVIWQTNFQDNVIGAGVEGSDADGDGDVDGADFVIWQTQFPSSWDCDCGCSAVPVAEPASFTGALLCALTVFSRCRRLRRIPVA